MSFFLMLLFGYLAYQYSKKGKMIRAFVCAFIAFVALTGFINDNHNERRDNISISKQQERYETMKEEPEEKPVSNVVSADAKPEIKKLGLIAGIYGSSKQHADLVKMISSDRSYIAITWQTKPAATLIRHALVYDRKEMTLERVRKTGSIWGPVMTWADVTDERLQKHDASDGSLLGDGWEDFSIDSASPALKEVVKKW